MKIIEMERRTMDGKPVEYNPVYENGEDFRDWWCVIETPEEELVYDMTFSDRIKGEYVGHKDKDIWNAMVKHAGFPQGLAWGDDDVYGYITPHKEAPEVGEKYTDEDGDEWVRIN